MKSKMTLGSLTKHCSVLSATSLVMFVGLIGNTASAQDFPTKPVKIIVGYAPGGNVDTPTRIVGRKLAENLKVAVVVENKPGAGGNVGADFVAKSPADGYTLLACGASSHGANSSLFAKLPYDPIKDLVPIAMFGTSPNVLVVHPSVKATTVAEFIAVAKSDPNKASIGSAGIGTSQHLSIELLKSLSGIQATHIPYKGGALAMADVMGGQVPAVIAGLPTAITAIQSGKVRALGVTTPKRSPLLPNVPTIAEAGVPGYDVTGWVGLCAPSSTPAQRLALLDTAVRASIKAPEVQKALADVGYEPSNLSSQQLADFIKVEIPKWAKVIREAGITPE